MASVLARIDYEELGQAGPATRFLSGIHRPMEAELTLTQLEARGTIPPALSGRYLRMGPNPVDADPASYHWFTGDGMVHGLALSDGKAHWYRNRWIASQANATARGTTTIRTIDAAPQEFPRINERRFGQAYRYAYTMAVQADRRFQSAGRLYKHDLIKGVRQVHDFGAGRHPGEFVFVPAHDDAGED